MRLILLVLLTAQFAAAETTVETGTLNGAAFRIELPANWKDGGLLMYCHGYSMAGSKQSFDSARSKAFRELFLSRGFAFAESAYRTQGWAIKEALEDTEALRQYFIKKYGKPRESYVTGHSMGGFLTMATLERFPTTYDAGMPLCPLLGTPLELLEERAFDVVVTFEHFFPGSVGPAAGLANDPASMPQRAEKIKAALAAAPDKAEAFAKRWELSGAPEVLGVVSFFREILRELEQRAGGNPFDNRNTIYNGFGDDAAVNRGVKRYAADAKARQYLRDNYTPTGRITRPMLAVHTTYDQLIPARHVNVYDAIATLAGTQDLFVEKFVDARGHCNFSPEQHASAFDQLLRWTRQKERPEAGEIK